MGTLTIVFDNKSVVDAAVPLWGFAAVIETDQAVILFDTGSNGRILKRNMSVLGFDFTRLTHVFISHPHWDHIGGWDTVAEENSQLEWIVPASLSTLLVGDLKKFAKSVTVVRESREIMQGVYSTGIMAEQGEQSLVLDTEKGALIVTGCGHPGAVGIINSARDLSSKELFGLVGGLHLFRSSQERIISLLPYLNLPLLVAAHCTGEVAQGIFSKAFPLSFKQGGIGARYEF